MPSKGNRLFVEFLQIQRVFDPCPVKYATNIKSNLGNKIPGMGAAGGSIN